MSVGAGSFSLSQWNAEQARNFREDLFSQLQWGPIDLSRFGEKKKIVTPNKKLLSLGFKTDVSNGFGRECDSLRDGE